MDGLQNLPDEIRQYILYLEKRIQDLERRLKAYETPYTPSSMQRFKGRSGGTNPPGKRGTPPGHQGATRDRPEPDEIIPVTMDQCPQCDSHLGKAISVESRTIEDLPSPQKITVTQYQLHTYICLGCGNTVASTHPDCPRVGDFGIRLLTHITMMKFHQRRVSCDASRNPSRTITAFRSAQKESMTSSCGLGMLLLRNMPVCCRGSEPPGGCIPMKPVRQSTKNHWFWMFWTDQDDVLAVIRPSRGKKVLDEILGAEFQGAMVNNGYHSYRSMPIVQRCWAHLLREVNDFKEPMDHEQQLSDEMHQRFTMLKTLVGKDPPLQERVLQKEVWDQELQRIVDEYCFYEDTRVKARYIQHGLGSWYTCLLYPGCSRPIILRSRRSVNMWSFVRSSVHSALRMVLRTISASHLCLQSGGCKGRTCLRS